MQTMDVPEDLRRVDMAVHRPAGSAADKTYLDLVSTVAVLYCSRTGFRVYTPSRTFLLKSIVREAAHENLHTPLCRTCNSIPTHFIRESA